jgi:hypothetical protein
MKPNKFKNGYKAVSKLFQEQNMNEGMLATRIALVIRNMTVAWNASWKEVYFCQGDRPKCCIVTFESIVCSKQFDKWNCTTI